MITARQVQFFLEELQEERYIDAIEYLVEFYNHANRYTYSERLSKIPHEDLIRENLPKHKHGIMKRILRYVRIFEQDEVNRFVPKMIAALRHFGVDWPDLDIVEKSINSNIKESDIRDEHLRYRVSSIADCLDQGLVKFAFKDIGSLSKDPTWPQVKAEVLDILAAHKRKIIIFLDSPVSSLFLQNVCMMLEIGIDWPEMQAFLSKRKTGIVKWLLNAVKEDHTPYVKSIVERMLRLNINWPELSIILKSANAELKSPTELDESDMTLQQLDDWARIEQNFNSNQIYYALLLIDKNDFNVVKHPDIGYLLDGQQDNIREFMLHRLERKDVFEFIRIADMIKSTRIGWTWPIELIEQKKTEVVKLLLSLILNPYAERELVLDLSWMLGKLGIQWPELSIIEKSVRSDNKNA